MRFLAAILLALFMTGPALAYSPDCVNVMTISGLQCVAKSSARVEPRQIGKPARRVVIAGKTFDANAHRSWHSDATAWIAEARRYKGMTGAQLAMKHRRLWCGEFMGKVAKATGMKTPRNPNWAADWAEVGHRISSPQPGAVALIARRGRIGHVGIVTGVDGNGNPIIISGNHNDRVVETAYPRGSVAAYIMPGA